MPEAKPRPARTWIGTGVAIAFIATGVEVSRYFLTELNQTGDPSLLWGMKGGWVLAGIGGFVLALVATRATVVSPPLLLTVVALLLATTAWLFNTAGDWTYEIISRLPTTWSNVALQSVRFSHFLVGFGAGWLHQTRRPTHD